MKYLKHQEDSKDLSVEIFTKVIHKLDQHDVQHFKAWLYRLTVNECLMQLRKKDKKDVSLDTISMEISDTEHPTYEDTAEQRLVLLEKCLKELKPTQQETVRLFYLKELSYQQVAVRTKYDLKKVKSYIQNGKRNLKKCMEVHG